MTALYEITPVGSGAELNDPLRYGTDDAGDAAMLPAATRSASSSCATRRRMRTSRKLIETPIGKDLAVDSLEQARADARWAAAVAAFGQKLKGSNYGDMSWADIRKLAQGARGEDEAGYRAEFMGLIDMAAVLRPNVVPAAPIEETEVVAGAGGRSRAGDDASARSRPRAGGRSRQLEQRCKPPVALRARSLC